MKLLALILAVSFMAGCLGDQEPERPNNFTSCLWKGGNTLRWQEFTSASYDTFAQYDYILTAPGTWRPERCRVAAGELKKRNPDIHLGQYFRALALPQWVIRNAPDHAYERRWLEMVEPYLAHTNGIDPATGELDTATTFLSDYAVNLLIPEARTAMIQAQMQHSDIPNVSWAMIDFLTSPIPDMKRNQPPAYRKNEHGDLDYDGDGIGHWDDLDEQEAFRDALLLYMIEMKEHFNGKVMMIANGRLGEFDEEFYPVLDGLYLEGFPWWTFCGEDHCFDDALNPNNSPSLWDFIPIYDVIMLEDRWDTRKYGHLAGLWDQTIELKRWWHGEEPPSLDTTRVLRKQLTPTLNLAVNIEPNRIERVCGTDTLWVRYSETYLWVGVR